VDTAGHTHATVTSSSFAAQEAIQFIENEANSKQPFMLYWTPDATHTPLYASEKFRGRSSRGLYVARVLE